MKTNYNTVMENIINNLKSKPTLLLHACCGICSLSVLERLKDYFDITVLYYNPNIYPKEEYDKRLDVLKEVIKKSGSNIKLMETIYNEDEFNDIAFGLEDEEEGGKRCSKCYYLRLEKTANIAKEKGFDYFTTTLSVSPYKSSDKLNKIGKILEEKYLVNYLYSDFKKKDGFKRSNELSYKYNLYRQDYCGCKYSFEKK
ncbi:MAG: epoxyqueuosine reductase QueH [Bacilli bacterium]|nr:epoxyqueuosine reductase QueH [Bacilli bacterium]